MLLATDLVDGDLEGVVGSDEEPEEVRLLVLEDVLKAGPGPPLNLLAMLLLDRLVKRE